MDDRKKLVASFPDEYSYRFDPPTLIVITHTEEEGVRQIENCLNHLVVALKAGLKKVEFVWPGITRTITIGIEYLTYKIQRRQKMVEASLGERPTLVLTNQEIDLQQEIIHNPFPTGLIEINNMELLIANELFFRNNNKQPTDMIGESIAGLCTPQQWAEFIRIIRASRSTTSYTFRAYQWNSARQRDEFAFTGPAKLVEFMGQECYAFSQTDCELISRIEF